MTANNTNEIVVARLSIEAAAAALESIFARMGVVPRAEKVIVSDTVQQACLRLQQAKDLLAQLEKASPVLAVLGESDAESVEQVRSLT